ncbi:MAG TPA: GT-D fold domain-containing glycosyltransferase [Candidatus Paceibacterota bacterium]|nr:GT-D fold domain-containing glycosyltransferase [Candidatus Paceibacterota bacterium]
MKFRKALDNPLVVFSYIWRHTYQRLVADKDADIYGKVRFLSETETLDELMNHSRSMIRAGDGTFGYLMGASIYFNNWHFRYNRAFARILLSSLKEAEAEGILLCFPHEQITRKKEEYRLANIPHEWSIWISAKILARKLLREGSTYGNSMCFHPKHNKHIDFPRIKHFLSTRHVYIVTSGVERFTDIKLGLSTTFIEAPANDAWRVYTQLEDSVLRVIRTNGHQKNEVLIMISAAEAAKVMILDLHRQGYVCWDTGQFFELACKQIAAL